MIVRFLFALSLICTVVYGYNVGCGIYDITGPIVEVNFLGYANPSQKGTGLHTRQYARAYIVDDGQNRFVFVNLDTAMIGYFIKKRILEDLKTTYGSLYNEQNVILSAVHTHSTPGGFMHDFLYDIATSGYVEESVSALRRGIKKAIAMAHDSLQPAKICINSGILLEANINRSPLSYLKNPQSERNEYTYNVDKEMVQLKFVASPSNKLLGVINWFPVHPNSMNSTNTLVSSDNVGYAAIKMEQHINQGELIGKGPFVASFASSNFGDSSPNLKGPHCINTGLPCDDVSSSCDGRSQQCIAFGPGNDMFESTEIIGKRLLDKALELLQSNSCTEVTGEIKFGHRYVDISKETVSYILPDGREITGKGCRAAVGYSFAAGTTDGPGHFDFTQSTTGTNLFWNIIRELVAPPSRDDIECQKPKAILFNTGNNGSGQWQSNINSLQVVVLGNVILAVVPSEFTTMSGRRLKKTLNSVYLENTGLANSEVVVVGLSNSYSSYVATYEEYQLQRYEGGSTLFGPHTLGIYQGLFKNLLKSLLKNEVFDKGLPPSNYDKNSFSFNLPVIFDTAIFSKFGACLVQPKSTYQHGETVNTVFQSANPRTGDLSSYSLAMVQKYVNPNWVTIATDANWETKYYWKRVGISNSEATITWYITADVQPGKYRIVHNGYRKFVGVSSFSGTSNTFTVV